MGGWGTFYRPCCIPYRYAFVSFRFFLFPHRSSTCSLASPYHTLCIIRCTKSKSFDSCVCIGRRNNMRTNDQPLRTTPERREGAAGFGCLLACLIGRLIADFFLQQDYCIAVGLLSFFLSFPVGPSFFFFFSTLIFVVLTAVRCSKYKSATTQESIVNMRRKLLVQRFVMALTSGQSSVRPIEMQAHDPVR